MKITMDICERDARAVLDWWSTMVVLGVDIPGGTRRVLERKLLAPLCDGLGEDPEDYL